MEDFPKERAPQSWWTRRSIFCKILLIALPILIVIGLAVGLGVGLTVGRGGSSSSSSSSPSTPLPPTNGTLWQPAVNSTWQIVLQNPLELASDASSVTPDVSIYDIDLFTNSEATISSLRNLGKRVICYFSAGSYEPDRPDSSDFKSSDKGKELDGWPGEYWLNLSSSNVRNIMKKRLDVAVQKGCDAVDPDNMDGYDNDNGLGLTEDDSVDYVEFLSQEAQARNLSMGLKNAGAIIKRVLPLVHFSVNEQCHQYSECTTYTPFVDAGKPVFNIEYPDGAPKVSVSSRNKYCSTSGDGEGATKFSTVIKKMDLDGWVEFCNGTTDTTALSSS